MKKTYIAPNTKMVIVNTNELLAGSLKDGDVTIDTNGKMGADDFASKFFGGDDDWD